MRTRFYKCEAEYCEGVMLVAEVSIQLDDFTTVKEAEVELKQLVANDFTREAKAFTPDDIILHFQKQIGRKRSAVEVVASWLEL